jgi:hypothetical protein
MNNEEDNKYFFLELNHDKKYKFKKNIIIKNFPPDYNTNKVEEYYRKIAKYNSHKLNNFNLNNFDFIERKSGVVWMLYKNKGKSNMKYSIFKLMNLIFNKDELNKIKTFTILDLSYTCGNYFWVIDQMKRIEDIFKIFFLEANITKKKINIVNNPYYDIYQKYKKLEELNLKFFSKISLKSKQDFIFIIQVLDIFKTMPISFYLEHIYSINLILHIYYILSFQKKNGSFILCNPSFDINLSRSYLRIMKNYYEKIYLFKADTDGFGFTYLIGKNFLGISKKDLDIFNKLYNDILVKIYAHHTADSVNIFDPIIRKKNYICKHIENFNNNDFVHNIITFEEEDYDLEKKLNEFNSSTFKYILKEHGNEYNILL